MSRAGIFALMASGLLLSGFTGGTVFAQDAAGEQNQNEGRRGRGGRGNFDPAQFRQRMQEMMKEQLGATDEEMKVLQPKIEKVMTAQRDARGGGFGFGGGRRGRGGDGGGGSDQAQSPVAKASADLRSAVEAKASDEEIKGKLQALRDARAKAREDLAAAQKELQEVVTSKQEAVLVMYGMLD